MLDVGCGNHSPTLARHWFPGAEYHGLDREDYNNTDLDRERVHRLYRLDLATTPLDLLPGAYFDVIVMAHVLEHLPNGLEVVAALATKLAPRGDFYLEFPSPRSLQLPSGRDSLHFCDDDTHQRIYSLLDVVNVLLRHDCRIVYAGRRRSLAGIAAGLLSLPFQAWSVLRHRRLWGPPLWELAGFADCVYAVRRSPGREV